ncbi:MAG: cysteine rich repeat-containing protein [Methylocystis sp.]
MRPSLSMLPIAFCFAIAPAQALAENQISAEVKEKCKADYSRLCSGVMPGGGRILACFQAHKDEVSPDCRDALAKVKN